MSMIKWIFAIYGLFLLSGAYFGWKAGSKVSLIMGVVCGLLIFLSVYLTGTSAQLGFGLITFISGFLSGVFLIRLIKTHHFMPAGMLALVSSVVFILSIIQLLKK